MAPSTSFSRLLKGCIQQAVLTFLPACYKRAFARSQVGTEGIFMQPSWVAVVWKCSQPVNVARLNTHQQNVIALMREWEFWLKYFQWLRRAKHSGPSIRVTCWCYSFLVCAHAYVCGYCLLWHSVFPVCSETHYSSTAWMLAFQVPFLRRLHCTLYDFILQPNVSLQKPQKRVSES